mgnify:CR=1 FL=1
MNVKFIKNIFLVLSVVLLSGMVGYKLGTREVKISWQKYVPNVEVINRLAPVNKPVDFSLFWSVWDEVHTKYVDKTKLDTQKLVYGAISGMVSAIGDPYTLFLPPTQNRESKEELNGSFDGIGAQLGVKDKRIIVIAPLLDSPAEKAGIKTSDWVIKVDGKDTATWTLPETVAKIRGPKGTSVVLTVLHAGADKPTEITIVRNTIVLKSVEWKIASGAAYLRLSRFGDKTDPQWDKVVSEISQAVATTSGVILDLRNNPGGYLLGAVYTGSEFLPASPAGGSSGVIVKQQSYTGEIISYSVNRSGKLLTVPMVVLVNQGTASAGEILAGALQVAKRAKVVGVQTFGKGSVQEAEDLSNGAGLHITTAKWLLSNDMWISGTGLTPDIKIENDEKQPDRDLQLEKALEVLKEK